MVRRDNGAVTVLAMDPATPPQKRCLSALLFVFSSFFSFFMFFFIVVGGGVIGVTVGDTSNHDEREREREQVQKVLSSFISNSNLDLCCIVQYHCEHGHE